MPFVAKQNQTRICSLDIPYEHWNTLKQNGGVFNCLDCGEQMHPKTINRTGTQFFAHNKLSPNCLSSQGESDAHIIAKEQLYNALKQVETQFNLINVGVEQWGESFRTDVWAETKNAIYLFEIQISNISYDTLIERSLKFYNLKTDKKIIPIWIFKRIPDVNKNNKIPSVHYPLYKYHPSTFCRYVCKICHRQIGDGIIAFGYYDKYREICNPKINDLRIFKEDLINKIHIENGRQYIIRDDVLNELRYTPSDELNYFKKCGIVISSISNKKFFADCYKNAIEINEQPLKTFIYNVFCGNQILQLLHQEQILKKINVIFNKLDDELKIFTHKIYFEISNEITIIKNKENEDEKQRKEDLEKQHIKFNEEINQQRLFIEWFGSTAHTLVELNNLSSRKYDPDQAISDFWHEFHSEDNLNQRIRFILKEFFDTPIYGNPNYVFTGHILIYKKVAGVVSA